MRVGSTPSCSEPAGELRPSSRPGCPSGGRGQTLAGQDAEALKARERSLALRQTTLDAVSGPYFRYQVARIYIQSGYPDRALDLIEPLLDKPGDITPAWLRIDPVFKPLASNPRFHHLARLD